MHLAVEIISSIKATGLLENNLIGKKRKAHQVGKSLSNFNVSLNYKFESFWKKELTKRFLQVEIPSVQYISIIV